MKAFHTKDLALVKHTAIVSDYTVAALNPEEPNFLNLLNKLFSYSSPKSFVDFCVCGIISQRISFIQTILGLL